MMKKQLIAIDIDDVVADFCPAFCEYAKRNWGFDARIEDYKEDWGSWFGFDENEWRKRGDEFFDNREFYLGLSAVEGAAETLKRLRDKYDVIAVTSRRSTTKDMTKEWLAKNFEGLVDEVHFSGAYDDLTSNSHTHTKGEVCAELGVEFLIDDQPKHCEGVGKYGINAVLFGNYGWNKDVEISNSVMRASDWNEVAKYFGV